MLTNADVTLYNKSLNLDTRDYVYIPVCLYGVFWEDSEDGTVIYIPHDVEAGGREYISPTGWKKLNDVQRRQYWTIQPETKAVRGITDYSYSGDVKAIESMFDCVVDIVKVIDFPYGSPQMQHWEVIAK